jgi:hypothetical protein
MTAAGVSFVRPPTVAPYGTVAVFEDLYGNRWDLIEYGGQGREDIAVLPGDAPLGPPPAP